MSYLNRAIEQAKKELDKLDGRRKELTTFLRRNNVTRDTNPRVGRIGFMKQNVISTALKLLEDKQYITINDIINDCALNDLSLDQQDDNGKWNYISQILANSKLFVQNRRHGWSKI